MLAAIARRIPAATPFRSILAGCALAVVVLCGNAASIWFSYLVDIPFRHDAILLVTLVAAFVSVCIMHPTAALRLKLQISGGIAAAAMVATLVGWIVASGIW